MRVHPVFLFLLVLLLAASSLPAATPARPVAIVYQLEGPAEWNLPRGVPLPLQLFAVLPAGAVLRVGPGGSLALAFPSGARYRLGAGSSAALAARGLVRFHGSIEELPPVSPFPALGSIDGAEHPGDRSAAVRVRGELIEGLVPNETVRSLADRTVLRFQAVPGASRYRVEVRDARGEAVFEAETADTEMRVPLALLVPGGSYAWNVKTVDRLGPVMRGAARFQTLDAATATALGLRMGMVVERVAPDWPAARAGLIAGDVIFAWSRAATPHANPEPAEGTLVSPFDLEVVRTEQAPRGLVTLRGTRGAEPKSWTLPAGWWWALSARPAMPEDLLAEYQEGWRSWERVEGDRADRRWAELVPRAGDPSLAAWFQYRRALSLRDHGQSGPAEAPFRAAVELLAAAGRPLEAAIVANEECRNLTYRSLFDRADGVLDQALKLADRVPGPPLIRGWLLTARATVASRTGDHARARELIDEAIALLQVQAPDSDNLSYSWNTAGVLAADRGDPAQAEEVWQAALAIQERIAPLGPTRIFIASNLGMVRLLQGDLETAEADLKRALGLTRRIGAGPEGIALALTNLGEVAGARGDLIQAEEYLREALGIAEQELKGHPVLPEILTGLGSVQRARGDLRSAGSFFERALGLHSQSAPESEEVAKTLVSLGDVAARLGAPATARERFERALALREKAGPGGILVAETLLAIGRMEAGPGGDPKAAERRFLKALRLAEAQLPEGLLVAEVLLGLGGLAEHAGDLPRAEGLLRRALDLRSRIAPGTGLEAEALTAVGRVEIARGASAPGTEHVCRAIEILDRQRSRIGGIQENAAAFEAAFSATYQACIEALWKAGRLAEAFHALERSRARAFGRLLAERDLRFAELSPAMRSERGRLDREYDRLQDSLGKLSLSKDEPEIARVLDALHEVRRRQAELSARHLREVPRVAALQGSEPLALDAARAALDSGTLLLAFAVGDDKTLLFAVHSGEDAQPGLAVFPLSIGRATLRREVESFRSLVLDPNSDPAALRKRGESLYRALFGPAEALVHRARRLLISPDGPLHALPFAALAHQGKTLAERKPIHLEASATVYSAFRRPPSSSSPPAAPLAAFGAPVYPPPGAQPLADRRIRSAVERGSPLQPLPSSRQEVLHLATLYPEAKIYLGADATEEKAKEAAPEARIVHFAVHGLLDESLPLNSGLALTIPEPPAEGQDNGLLQAWEIFESLRLNADLVTLSACDTALGKDAGGEGILGLTRAFQFAGARSVVASLWSVSDASTPELMRRFYTYLRAGETKAEALRRAQVDLLRSGDPRLAHPYHWAAFQLYGGWE